MAEVQRGPPRRPGRSHLDSLYAMSPDWREMRSLQGNGFLANADVPSVGWMDAYLFPEDQAEVRAEIEAAVAQTKPFELEHRVPSQPTAARLIFSRACRSGTRRVVSRNGSACRRRDRAVSGGGAAPGEGGVHAWGARRVERLHQGARPRRKKLTFMSEGGKRVMEVSDFNAVAGCPGRASGKGPGNVAAKEAVASARAGVAAGFQGYADTMKATGGTGTCRSRRSWGPTGSPSASCRSPATSPT